jgi:hypothetical protein
MLPQKSGSASTGRRKEVTERVFGVAVFCITCGAMRMRVGGELPRMQPTCVGHCVRVTLCGPRGHTVCHGAERHLNLTAADSAAVVQGPPTTGSVSPLRLPGQAEAVQQHG